MRRLRVCFYGGTDLGETHAKFIHALTYRILDSMPAVIVTGGFLHSYKEPNAKSTDSVALEGARDYSEQRGLELRECFEAWIPEPSFDGRRDVGGVVRMSDSQGIAVRIMQGRTPLGRRLAMVGGVDLVVTISGKVHTEVVVEQALELGVPVLPIPDAGGDSRSLLEKYRQRIAASFDPGALESCLGKVSAFLDEHPREAGDAVVQLLRTAKVGRCLVLLPYDDEHKKLYKETLEPAIARHMLPVRLDRLPKSDAIYTSFADAIRTCTAVIADITAVNENVMYEVGYAHGRGLTPLLIPRIHGGWRIYRCISRR